MLKQKHFNGEEEEEEDANQHTEDIEEIADLFNTPGVNRDAIMLRIFPITLHGVSKRWIKTISSVTITTWGMLKTAFIKQFSSPSKIARLRYRIQQFKQKEKETLYESWIRYKDYTDSMPTT